MTLSGRTEAVLQTTANAPAVQVWPYWARPEWRQALWEGNSELLTSDTNETGAVPLLLHEQHTRALPGHVVWRTGPLSARHAGAVGRTLLRRVVERAQRSPVVSVTAEIATIEDRVRDALREHLQVCGFERCSSADRIYERTLIVSLAAAEEDVFAGFSTKARRDIRAAERSALILAPITDRRQAPQLADILRSTLARSGGAKVERDWQRLIDAACSFPSEAALIGASLPADESGRQLVAFGLAFRDGPIAHYDLAGSLRVEGVKIPLLYPVLWQLIRWARGAGAHTFDLGGVLPEASEHLRGISDFKRWFSKQESAFGEEWVYHPSKLKASIAGFATRVANRARRRN
jgi:hypothetical protein